MNPPAAKGCLDRNNDIKLAFMSMCSDDVDTVDDKKLCTRLATYNRFSASHHCKGDDGAREWDRLEVLVEASNGEGYEPFSYPSLSMFYIVQ